MVVLRGTGKLLKRLGAPVVADPGRSATVLGDWYADIFFTRPCQVVLCVSETSRLPVVLAARELRTLGTRLPVALGLVLADLMISWPAITWELAAMSTVVLAKTASRSVLGTLNDFAISLTWALAERPDTSLHQLSL